MTPDISLHTKTPQRDHNLDLIKCIAIYLVVLIHYCNYYLKHATPDYSVNYICALLYNVFARVSVPLFFMASGALAFRKEFNYQKNKQKIIHMIIVLLSWNIIYWLWNYFYLGWNMDQNIISYLFIPVKNHLWYMYAYIGLLIANPIIDVLAKHMSPRDENYFLLTWIILCSGVRTLDCILDYCGISTGLEYYIPIIQGTYYLGYYLVGHILYKRIRQHADSGSPKAASALHRSRQEYLALSAVLLTICGIITFLFSMYKTHHTENPLFGYSNILIVIPALCLFIMLMNIHIKGNALLVLINKYSFGVYLSHVLIYNVVYTLYDVRAMDSPFMLPFLALITFIITLAFVAVTSEIPLLKKVLY